jgi:hypothetical protein
MKFGVLSNGSFRRTKAKQSTIVMVTTSTTCSNIQELFRRLHMSLVLTINRDCSTGWLLFFFFETGTEFLNRISMASRLKQLKITNLNPNHLSVIMTHTYTYTVTCQSDSRRGFGMEIGCTDHFNTRLVTTLQLLRHRWFPHFTFQHSTS